LNRRAESSGRLGPAWRPQTSTPPPCRTPWRSSCPAATTGRRARRRWPWDEKG